MQSVNQSKSNDGAEFPSDAVLSQHSAEVGATVRDAVCARLSGDSQSYGQCEEDFQQLSHGTRDQFKALVGQCWPTNWDEYNHMVHKVADFARRDHPGNPHTN